jgi:hypothetical protein
MPSKLRNSVGGFVQADALSEAVLVKEGATIATAAGANSVYFTAPVTGSLVGAEMAPLVALAANNTNYITFTVVNLGQAGAGSTAMLAVSDANTTKATGGTGLGINTRRQFTLHGTAANIAVTKGDRLQVIATVTGTLANTVTVPVYTLTFQRS